MYMILFADDIVIFTTNPTSLQSQIQMSTTTKRSCRQRVLIHRGTAVDPEF